MRLMMKIFLAEAAPTDDYATAEQMLVRKEHGQDSTYLPACQTQLGMMSFCTTCTEYELNAFSESTDWGALIRR